MTEAPDFPNGQELRGGFAVVTGAAQGLGLAIVEALGGAGAAVLIGDLQLDKAQEEAERLRTKGLDVRAGQVDIGDTGSVDAFFEKAVESGRRLDILVNNAGVGQNIAPLSQISDQEWERVLNITLTGTFRCCRCAARLMEDQKTGCIVNIASVNGQNPAALAGAYNVAKSGVISLTRTLALELAAYGVRVNAVSPGPVYTEFNRSVMAQRCRSLGLTEEEMVEKIRAAIPLGRWGEGRDIASAVLFLCSGRAGWITGEVLRVSGGLEGVSAAPPRRS